MWVICAACGSVNSESARFCSTCGAGLEWSCAVCGTPNAAMSGVCRACGAQRRLPVAGESHSTRRIVTVLFADLVSSTAVAERLDPDAWAELAERFLSAMSEPVARFGGTVARLMGDGLLALFGAPVAHEDDAERAVRAGLAIIEEVAALRAELDQHQVGSDLDQTELQARVGINTGPVVVGEVGGFVKSEYTALGDAVNVAARLEQAASAGTALISASTRSLVQDMVTTGPAQTLDVKGKAESVIAYMLESLRPGPADDRGMHDTVGRSLELASLVDHLGRLTAGRGCIALVEGDAGLGKTRLLEDARRLTTADLAWVEVACRSFEATMPYALARSLLRDLCPDTAFEGLLAHVGSERREILVSVLEQVSEGAGLEGEMGPRAVAAAFGEILTGITHLPPPLVVVLDDLHWTDQASADLVIELLGWADRLPVGFVCAARPDRRAPSWRITQKAETDYPHLIRRISVVPLDRLESARLIQHLLGGTVEPGLLEALTDHGSGNPFYLEEFIEELRQTGGIVQTDGIWSQASGSRPLGLPASLQNLLQSRFDRLDASTRTVLELAAVSGSPFSRSLLRTVRGGDVDSALSELQRVGLIDAVDRETMAFRHSLTQEAAYQSIVQRDRRRLHQLIGRALEEGADVRDHPALAAHFLAAGDLERAARYSLAAGDAAASLQAFDDAVAHYERGLGAQPTGEMEQRLRLGLGRIRTLLGDIDGGLEELERALRLSRAADSPELEWDALIALGELWASRDYARAGELYASALDLARRFGRQEQIGISLNRLGNWYVNASDPTRGIAFHEEALALFKGAASLPGIADSHDLLGMANALTGEREEAIEHWAHAVDDFRSLGDRTGLAGALASNFLGAPNYEELTRVPIRSAEAALEAMAEAQLLTEALGWPAGEAYVRFNRAQVLGAVGRLGEGLTDARTALAIADRIGHEQWRVASLLTVGMLEGEALQVSQARSHLRQGYEGALAIGSRNWILAGAGLLALRMLEDGDAAGAAELTGGALGVEHAGSFLTGRVSLLAAAWVAVEAGDIDGALALVDPFDPAAPAVAWVRAKALAPRRRDAAIEALRLGLEAAKAWDIRPFEWRLHLALAALGVGRIHLEAARDILEACAETLDVDERAEMRKEAQRMLAAFDRP